MILVDVRFQWIGEAVRLPHALLIASLTYSVAGCAGAKPRLIDPAQLVAQPHAIQVTDDFRHAASGAVFPERVGLMFREQPQAYDRDEYDVSAQYVLVGSLWVTAYVYPAGAAVSGRLRNEFLKSVRSFERLSKGAKRMTARVVRPAGTPASVGGFEATWNVRSASGRVDRVERLQVFQCGQWFLKLRGTCRAEATAKLRAALRRIQAALSCRAIARANAVGPKIVVVLNPDMDEQSALPWLAYALGLMAWTRDHVPRAERVYGAAEHSHAMYFEALSHALQVHEEMAAKGKSGDPLFNALAAAKKAGFLDELVWSWHFDFLDPEPSLRLDLGGFGAWFAENVPGLEIEAKSAIELVVQ